MKIPALGGELRKTGAGVRVCSYYEVLMVTRDAPPEVIRAAYKALTQKWHPDRNSHEDAAEITGLLNRAYAELSDPAKRREYDEWLADAEASPDAEPAPAPIRRGTPFVVDEDKIRPALAELERRQRWKLSSAQKRFLFSFITLGIFGALT